MNEKYFIPFKITSEDSKKILKKELSFIFKPFSLKIKNVLLTEKNFYLPCDIFNYTLTGNITIQASNIYKKEITNYNVKYNIDFTYENVFLLKNNIITSDDFQVIEPFTLNNLTNNTNYQVLEDNISINEEVKKEILKDTLKKVKYQDNHTKKKILSHNINIKDTYLKTVYVPIKTYNYTYKNETNMIIINGQNGKILTHIKKSKPKLIFIISIFFITIFIISSIIAYFL